jgi:hypothetical protein
MDDKDSWITGNPDTRWAAWVRGISDGRSIPLLYFQPKNPPSSAPNQDAVENFGSNLKLMHATFAYIDTPIYSHARKRKTRPSHAEETRVGYQAQHQNEFLTSWSCARNGLTTVRKPYWRTETHKAPFIPVPRGYSHLSHLKHRDET